MRPAPFRYVRAESLEHALAALAEDEDGKVLAGGQSLLPMLNLRLARPSTLVDIGRLGELSKISLEDDTLSVGALTTHRAMEQLPDADRHLPGLSALRRAAGLIGHYPIRVRGTVGGSLAHADPAAEWPLMTLVLSAVVEAQSPRGRRSIDASHFYQGLFTTSLKADELVVAVRFRDLRASTAIEEHAIRRGDFAIAAAAASITVEHGSVSRARIALGGVASRPLCLDEEAGLLAGVAVQDRLGAGAAALEAGERCGEAVRPPSDLHASSAYRRRLAKALVTRAVLSCFEQERARADRTERAA